jgi:hypothetical protein
MLRPRECQGWWNVIVTEGGRVFFSNNIVGSRQPDRFHGKGFDSGLVKPGDVAEVRGVGSLPIGTHVVFNLCGDWFGVLTIEPPDPEAAGPLGIPGNREFSA